MIRQTVRAARRRREPRPRASARTDAGGRPRGRRLGPLRGGRRGGRAAARAIAAAPRLDIGRAEACVALTTDAEIACLNETYRGKPTPTNVLSFPAGAGARAGGIRRLGDIVLAAETIAREANEQGIPPLHHLQHLVVHGVLHLLGFDHETDRDAEHMEAAEVEILARLGIANPYGDGETSPAEASPVHSTEAMHDKGLLSNPTDEAARSSGGRAGSPACAPGSACRARRPCATRWRSRSRRTTRPAPSPPRSAACCCACCGSAARAWRT